MMQGIGGIGAGAPPAEPTQVRDVAAPDEGQPNVSPEEQAQYDQFVLGARDLIYPDDDAGEPQVAPAILSHLRGEMDPDVAAMFQSAEPPLSPNPIDNLASATVALVLFVEASSAQAGQQIDDAVIMHGGAEILGDLADVADAAKIHDYTPDELEGATYRAFDLYRTTSGRVDQAALEQEFAQIAAADAAGDIESVLPGIGQRMTGG